MKDKKECQKEYRIKHKEELRAWNNRQLTSGRINYEEFLKEQKKEK